MNLSYEFIRGFSTEIISIRKAFSVCVQWFLIIYPRQGCHESLFCMSVFSLAMAPVRWDEWEVT